MLNKALSFLRQVLRWDVTQAVEELGLDRRSRQEFPRPLALQGAFRQALLARSPQQVTAGLAGPGFGLVFFPGAARRVRSVGQALAIAPAGRVEYLAH